LKRKFRQTSSDGRYFIEVFYEAKGKKIRFTFHAQSVKDPNDFIRLCSPHHGKKVHLHIGRDEESETVFKDLSYGSLLRFFRREFKTHFGGEVWNKFEM